MHLHTTFHWLNGKEPIFKYEPLIFFVKNYIFCTLSILKSDLICPISVMEGIIIKVGKDAALVIKIKEYRYKNRNSFKF